MPGTRRPSSSDIPNPGMVGLTAKDLLMLRPLRDIWEQNRFPPAPLLSYKVFSSEILISGADESLVVIISDYRLWVLIILTVAGE